MRPATASAVIALVGTDLRPAVGEPVELWAVWDGAWPAEVVWQGVDASDGLRAVVTPRAPGDVTVRAGERTLLLRAQPAGNGAVAEIEPVVVPLLDVDADACRDDRFPALTGPWLVGCSATGLVDRALHLGTRARVELRRAVASPGLGHGALYDAVAGLWRLPEPAPEPVARLASPAVGPPATDGTHVAVALVDHVEAFPADAKIRSHTEARPLPGARVALAWPWAAWVQREPATGEDVWVRGEAGAPRPLARGEGPEWRLGGDDRWIGWIGPDAVFVEDLARGERRRYPADAGFLGELALWGPVACWEDRAALRAGRGDVDVRCSDGVVVRRPGHQLHPARVGPWIVFREEGRVLLGTVPQLVLDDDDPRAEGAGATVAGGWRGARREGAVSWTFDWPAEGWRVERWEAGGWTPGEALPVGRVTVTHPGGDAVRIVPIAGAPRDAGASGTLPTPAEAPR